MNLAQVMDFEEVNHICLRYVQIFSPKNQHYFKSITKIVMLSNAIQCHQLGNIFSSRLSPTNLGEEGKAKIKGKIIVIC